MTTTHKTNGSGPGGEARREKALDLAQKFNPTPADTVKILQDAAAIEAFLRDGKPAE